MLRNYLLTALFNLALIFGANAQINIGSLEKPNLRDGAGQIRKSDARRLQRSKTIFFYGDRDEENLPMLKKIFQKAWKLNSIEFDHIKNFKKYERARNTAFITLEVNPIYKVNTNIGRQTEIDCEVYYLLWVPKSRERMVYARIDLYPEHNFLKKLIKLPKPEDKLEMIYKKGQFYNDSPGMLGLYLRYVSKSLTVDDNINGPSLYEDWAREDSASLGLLRNQTLYVPDYVLIEEDLKDDTTKFRDEQEFFEDYPHQYEFVRRELLSDLIVDDEELMYIFVYVQSGEAKHFSVFTTSGEILFHEFEGNSFNLKPNDIRELARSVGD